jgi:hypothetical protein
MVLPRTKSLIHWSGHGLLQRPSPPYTVANRAGAYATFADYLAIQAGAILLTALVEPLFRSGGPAQIAGLIASIIVSSVQGMLQAWSLTNVFTYPTPEDRKVISPFRMHINAPTMVIRMIFRHSSCGSSLPYIKPRSKQIRGPSVTGNALAVRSVFVAGNFSLPATAGSAFSSPDTNGSRHGFLPAIALEQPEYLTAACLADRSQTDKAGVSLASHIKFPGHEPPRSAQYLCCQCGGPR